MTYHAFLLVLSQLAGKKKANTTIDGNEILIEALPKKNQWILSIKVFAPEQKLPSKIKSLLTSNGVMRWQSRGPYLKVDPRSHAIYLIDEVQVEEGKFIPFKRHLTEFSKLALEWREIFA